MKKSVLSLVLFIPSVCHAWGVDGHRIVAQIASQNLDPQARAAVKSILDGKAMTDVSSWADQIRKEPAYAFTDGCHGAKFPADAKSFNMKRDCADGHCAPAAIEKYSAVLANPKATPAERLDALRFVIHFVGDIHCPVHASYAAKGKVPDEVTFFGEKFSLHKLWDGGLIAHVNKPWEQYAAELGRAITKEQRRQWAAVTDPGDWATESRQAFVNHVLTCPKDNVLGEEYYKANMPTVNQRLSMAGIRLAARLNSILGKAATTRPAAATMPR